MGEPETIVGRGRIVQNRPESWFDVGGLQGGSFKFLRGHVHGMYWR